MAKLTIDRKSEEQAIRLHRGNAVSIAISRRRYPQQDNGQEWVGGNNKIEYNAYG